MRSRRSNSSKGRSKTGTRLPLLSRNKNVSSGLASIFVAGFDSVDAAGGGDGAAGPGAGWDWAHAGGRAQGMAQIATAISVITFRHTQRSPQERASRLIWRICRTKRGTSLYLIQRAGIHKLAHPYSEWLLGRPSRRFFARPAPLSYAAHLFRDRPCAQETQQFAGRRRMSLASPPQNSAMDGPHLFPERANGHSPAARHRP